MKLIEYKNKIVGVVVVSVLMALILTSCEDYTEDYNVPDPSLVASFSIEGGEEGFSAEEPITFRNQSLLPSDVSNPVFYWDFGDGNDTVIEGFAEVTMTNGKVREVFDTLTYAYDTATQYTVSLKVTAGERESAISSQKVLVEAGGDELFAQDFDDINVFPEDWELINGDGGTVATSNQAFQNLSDSAWIVWYSGLFSSNIAVGTSWYNEEVDADDWMITPEIELGSQSMLTFEAVSLTSSGDFPDNYQVFVSTTTQDAEGCLANGAILTVAPEEAGEDVGGDGIQLREVNLSEYAGQSVYIGFRLNTTYPGGDRLGIDNIKVMDL